MRHRRYKHIVPCKSSKWVPHLIILCSYACVCQFSCLIKICGWSVECLGSTHPKKEVFSRQVVLSHGPFLRGRHRQAGGTPGPVESTRGSVMGGGNWMLKLSHQELQLQMSGPEDSTSDPKISTWEDLKVWQSVQLWKVSWCLLRGICKKKELVTGRVKFGSQEHQTSDSGLCCSRRDWIKIWLVKKQMVISSDWIVRAFAKTTVTRNNHLNNSGH